VRSVPHSFAIIRTNPHPELGPMALNVLRMGFSGSHIRIPVGEACLLPATVCADEYFSLFSKAAVSRLN
jgi:hypothetical protein